MEVIDIVHEVPGRMRVRLPEALTFKQADLIQWCLKKKAQIDKVSILIRTSDIIIEYHDLSRRQLIDMLLQIDLKDQVLLEKAPDSGIEISSEYWDQLVSLIVSRVFRRVFFPVTLRDILAVIHSIPFIIKGIKHLFKKDLTVEVLDASALTAAIATQDFTTAGSVTFLLKVGDILEKWTYRKSVANLAHSMELNVTKVWRRRGDQEEAVPLQEIETGDLIHIQMGKTIPLDGTVVSGEGMVNQAALTGESIPVAKKPGRAVFAGTVLEDGELCIEVKTAQGDTRYEKIMTMIEESEKLKSQAQVRAENLADRLVPYTFGISLLTYIITRDVTKALSALMVDYSCALKLSAPISVLSAMQEASGSHICVKGGSVLEKIADADTIIFDKTGTLTKAVPTVKEVVATNGMPAKEALRTAACLEEHFPHSMANAVVKAAKQRGLSHDEMHSKVEYIVAHGIVSSIDGKRAVIGSYHFVFEDEMVQVSEEGRKRLEQISDEYSHLYLGIDGRLEAVICIADPLRDEAAAVIAALQEKGVRCVMMTGDNERTAKVIAGKVGISEFYAEVLPEDKSNYVKQERAQNRTVLMIGDGINDSPALSEADVGIAIEEGADIAQQVADVTISQNDLRQLLVLRALSEALMKRLKHNRNVIVSFNSGVIMAGITGILSPGLAALLHNTSTVAISLHSMSRLLPET